MEKAVFSVDVERDLRTGKFEGIKALRSLAGMLEKHSIKATFFVTGEVLEKCSSILKLLAKKGHEIAVHGYSHKRYDLMSKKEKEEDLKKAIKAYKKVLGKSPKGFRAPQHSIDNETIDLLCKHDFKYDSSKVPGNIMLFRHLFKKGNKKSILKNFFSKLKPYKLKNGLIEIPRNAFLISTGGFELKVYPAVSYKFLMALNQMFNLPLIFTMHSWDMINIPESRTSKVCGSKRFKEKLDGFLEYSAKKLKYLKMGELLTQK